MELENISEYEVFLKHYYSELYKNTDDEKSSNHETISAIVKYLKENRIIFCGQNIIDIGCGKGELVDFFAEKNFVQGLDLCRIPEWERIENLYPQNVEFIIANFNLWKSEYKFDLVIDNGCFHHQHPDVLANYLIKIKSLFQNKNSKYYLTIFDKEEGEDDVVIDKNGRFINLFDDEYLDELLEGAGLKALEQIVIKRREGIVDAKFLIIGALNE